MNIGGEGWLRRGWELVRKYQYPLLILAVGVFLLYLGRGDGGEAQSEQSAAAQQAEQSAQGESFDLDAFEERLGMTLANIQGAGRVQVVLSLKTAGESVYAADVRRSNGELSDGGDYESTLTVVSDRTSGESPVLVKTYYPEFLGALVVCDGADDPQVCSRILQAVQAVCGLTSAEVSITKMKA